MSSREFEETSKFTKFFNCVISRGSLVNLFPLRFKWTSAVSCPIPDDNSVMLFFDKFKKCNDDCGREGEEGHVVIRWSFMTVQESQR